MDIGNDICNSNIHINFNSCEFKNDGETRFDFKNLKNYNFDQNFILYNDDSFETLKNNTSFVWFGQTFIINNGIISSKINFIIKDETDNNQQLENVMNKNVIYNPTNNNSDIIKKNNLTKEDYDNLKKLEKNDVFSTKIKFRNFGRIELITDFIETDKDGNTINSSIKNDIYFVFYHLIFMNNGTIITSESRDYKVNFYFYSYFYNKGNIECLSKSIIYQILKNYTTLGSQTFNSYSLILNIGNIKCDKIIRSLYNVFLNGTYNHDLIYQFYYTNKQYMCYGKFINFSNIEVSEIIFDHFLFEILFFNNFGSITVEKLKILNQDFINNGQIQFKKLINSKKELTYEYYSYTEDYNLSEYVDKSDGQIFYINHNINYGLFVYDNIILNKYYYSNTKYILNDQNIENNLNQLNYGIKLKQNLQLIKNTFNYQIKENEFGLVEINDGFIKNNFGIYWDFNINLIFNSQMLFDNTDNSNIYITLDLNKNITDTKLLFIKQVKSNKNNKIYFNKILDSNQSNQTFNISDCIKNNDMTEIDTGINNMKIYVFCLSIENYENYYIFNNCYFYYSNETNKSNIKKLLLQTLIEENNNKIYQDVLSSFGVKNPMVDSEDGYKTALKSQLLSLLDSSLTIDTTADKWAEKAIDDYKESKIKEIEDLKKQLNELKDQKNNTSDSGEIQVLNNRIQNLINQIDSLTMKINKLAVVTIMGINK